ncbi:hypothetical protein BO86DRAFT_244445 [Aspergillus japonicus CBS 114.51]|uniref:Uncharacterized protein n=1 Tax=Aspergillus japonicus CBS 114.51 TaxID=1448312 RepID=A0A8T8X8I8_ASPJA|nr:hypothetical protein BO86DRAFT_244445 [Aspergillus japonicus CBS 114.51]RAH84487.1 hypothetical protein BO86DRAFT_244445 [Aspergillus japonicus CBS 114.51]
MWVKRGRERFSRTLGWTTLKTLFFRCVFSSYVSSKQAVGWSVCRYVRPVLLNRSLVSQLQ